MACILSQNAKIRYPPAMIILPRPAPHLPRTLAAVQAAGFSNVLPLALSHPQPVPATIPQGATALIFTSIFAVRTGFPSLPAYCVGETTAAAARAAGYTVVYTGTNNGHSMAQAIASHAKQHFVHLHGDHAGMDWHLPLKQAGHTVTPVMAYHTKRVSTLPPQALATLAASKSHTLTLLFSAGSASHLAKLYKHANIMPVGTAIALSPAVAKAAAAHWPQVITAPAPTLEGMLQAARGQGTPH